MAEKIVTTVRLPRDMHDWLMERANYFGTSPNIELVRFCRLAMESEGAGKDRTTVAAGA